MNNFPEPINENVLILPDEVKPDEADSGSFITPDELKDKPRSGMVAAASTGYYAKETGEYIPLDVKKGNHVLYRPFKGDKLSFNGKEYLLLTQSDILLILKK